MKPWISALGLYNLNPKLFDGFTVPQGLSRDIALARILTETANLELQYPDMDTMEALIPLWSQRKQYAWQKLYDTLNFEYNPIHNYDRTEEGLDQEERNRKEIEDTTAVRDFDDTRTDTGTVNVDEDSSSKVTGNTTGHSTSNSTTDSSQETKTSAYNSNQYQPKELVDTTTTVDTTADDTVDTTTDTTADRNQLTTNNLQSKDTAKTVDDVSRDTREGQENKQNHFLHAYGNIGVTTTQQMIQQEQDIVVYDIYTTIVRDFMEEFCILVY